MDLSAAKSWGQMQLWGNRVWIVWTVWIVEGCIKCISCEVNNHNRNNNKNNTANIRIEFFSVLCYIKSGESCLFYDSVAFLSVTLTDLSQNFMFCRVTLFHDRYFNTSKLVNEKDFLRTGKTLKKLKYKRLNIKNIIIITITRISKYFQKDTFKYIQEKVCRWHPWKILEELKSELSEFECW